MLLLGGSIFSNSTLSTNTRTNEENKSLNVETEVGLFLTKRNLIGTRISFQSNYSRGINIFTGIEEQNFDYLSELSSFYRFYPIPKKRLGIFGEMQLTLIGNSQTPDSFYKEFKAQIGTGAYVFLTDNLAFEMSISSLLFHQTSINNEPPKLIANFSLLRNFKGPRKTRLPKLEDTYLFVRNLYYGLGVMRSFNDLPTNIPRNRISLNSGFFIGSHWLLDVNYTFEDFRQFFSNDSFSELRLESAFFIRLNQKATYLRPSLSFKLEGGSRIRRANPDLAGFRKFAYIYNLEVAQFFGDQLIFGGGASMVMTRFDVRANHFQFNTNLRLTYFVTKDFAVEATGAFFLFDKFVNRTTGDLNLTLSSVNSEIKIRHFLFQK